MAFKRVIEANYTTEEIMQLILADIASKGYELVDGEKVKLDAQEEWVKPQDCYDEGHYRPVFHGTNTFRVREK